MYLDKWLGRTFFDWEEPCFNLRVGLAEEVIHLSGKRPKQLDAPGISEIIENFLPIDGFSIVFQRVNTLECNSRINSTDVVPQCWHFSNF